MANKKIICYDTDRKITTDIVRNFAQGINEYGGKWVAECRPLNDFRKNGLPNNADAICSLGILRGTGLIFKSAASRGINRIYLDHSYFNSGYNGKGWLRATVNGHTMNWLDTNVDSARWKTNFKNNNLVMEWKNASQRGKNILILPPTDAVCWYFDCYKWLEDTVNQIKQIIPESDWPLIKIRYKPSEPFVDKLGNLIKVKKRTESIPLQQDLDEARVVIVYNSNSGITALSQGIPVISSEHSSCFPASLKIKDINNDHALDQEPNRRQLFFWLSHCQFNEKERRSGSAWKQILEYQRSAFI